MYQTTVNLAVCSLKKIMKILFGLFWGKIKIYEWEHIYWEFAFYTVGEIEINLVKNIFI